MLQCFLLSKQIFMEQNAYVRITENKAYLQERLSKVIQMAGSFPCSSFTRNQILIHPPELDLDKILGTQSLEVFKARNSNVLSNLTLQMQPNSSVLWVKYTQENFPVASMLNSLTGTITLEGHAYWEKGDTVLVSDCTHLGVFELMEDAKLNNNKTQIKINTEKMEIDLRAFNQNARVGKLLSIYYFIADSNRKTHDGHTIWSLYEKESHTAAMELMEGIDGWEVESRVLPNSHMIQVKAKVWFNSVEPARASSRLVKHFYQKFYTRNLLDTQTYLWNSKI